MRQLTHRLVTALEGEQESKQQLLAALEGEQDFKQQFAASQERVRMLEEQLIAKEVIDCKFCAVFPIELMRAGACSSNLITGLFQSRSIGMWWLRCLGRLLQAYNTTTSMQCMSRCVEM